MYLFIDTTKFITVGILDIDFSWLSYEFVKDQKSSASLHIIIYEALENLNLDIKDLSGVIYMAGPGSYTGMRVSQGFVDVCRLEGMKVFSLYHFDVPKLTKKYEHGTWYSEAFKGEYFVHRWSETDNESKLVLKKDFDLKQKNLFTSIPEGDELSTSEILKNNSKEIFKEIVDNNVQKELYYYRSIDQEYQRS